MLFTGTLGFRIPGSHSPLYLKKGVANAQCGEQQHTEPKSQGEGRMVLTDRSMKKSIDAFRGIGKMPMERKENFAKPHSSRRTGSRGSR